MNSVEVLTEEKKREIMSIAEETLQNYESVEIIDQTSYEMGGEYLKAVKLKFAEIEGIRKPITRQMDAAKKLIMDFFRRPLDLLSQAENSLKRKMLQYQSAVEKKRLEEEARLQELARKEEERQKKLLDKRIENARKNGKEEKVEELMEKKEQVFIPAPIVAKEIKQVKGISNREVWKYDVVDFKLLPDEYKQIDDKKLGQVVRATKNTLAIPGVRIYSEEGLSARKR